MCRLLLALLLAFFASGCVDDALANSGPSNRTRIRNRRATLEAGLGPDAAVADVSDATISDVSDAFVADTFVADASDAAVADASDAALGNDNAFQFDGVDEQLSAADSAWQESASTHTLCFWTSAATWEEDDGFVDKGSTQWEWDTLVGQVVSTNARVKTCVSSSCGNTKCAASGGQWLSTNFVLTPNVGHFVCSVWNSANADATKIQLYEAGAALAQSQTGTAPTTMQDCAAIFTVGHGASTHQLGGTMDEITWWNTALTASEIAKLCCGATSCPGGCLYIDPTLQSISGLVGWWRADGSTVPNALDSSGNGNTLTSANMEAGDFGPPVP